MLIANGRVTVDGKAAKLGMQVDPDKAVIAVDGRVIGAASAPEYILLHKPAGVTSTVRDRHASKTVLDMIPTALLPEGGRLYPSGGRPGLRRSPRPDQRRGMGRSRAPPRHRA